MRIHGINKLTLLDYPEHTACTLFTGGCSFRCPFCQNGSLVLDPAHEPVIDEEWLWKFLEKRRSVLQGVCITGGEPTLQKDLPDFIRRIRSMGYLVKLDTNGYQPEVLEELLREGLLDMAAMDIKSSRQGYAKAAGFSTCARGNERNVTDASRSVGELENGSGVWNLSCEEKCQQEISETFDLDKVERSVELLRGSGITYEFRTTVVKELVTEEDMEDIGAWLAGVPRYFLQNYVDSQYVLDRSMHGCSLGEMQHLLEVARKKIPAAQLRGI